jgi:hypothetical protein
MDYFSETDIWCDLHDLLGFCMLTKMPLTPAAGDAGPALQTWMVTRIHSSALDEPIDEHVGAGLIEDAP